MKVRMKNPRGGPDKHVELGTFIKEVREVRDLSQGDLASLCGVSRVTVHNIETNKHAPMVDTLEKILAVLGYSMVIQFGVVE